MPTFASLDTKKASLIRKAVDGAVYVAPVSVAALDPTVLFDAETGELQAFPAGYVNVGYLTTDGAQFSRDVDESDIASWGSNDPTRSDKTNDTTTLQMSCQETNAQTIAQYVGVDASTFAPSASGVLMVKKPTVGNSQYRRVFSIGVDQDDNGDEIYIVRFLPRAKVTDYDDQAFANGDDPILWPVTYTGYRDNDFGASEAFLFGGPGWTTLAEDMGFTLPTG